MEPTVNLVERDVPAVGMGDLTTIYNAGIRGVEDFVGTDSHAQQHLRFAGGAVRAVAAYPAASRGALVMRAIALWSATVTDLSSLMRRGLLTRRVAIHTEFIANPALVGAFALVRVRGFTSTNGSIWDGYVKYSFRDLLDDAARLSGNDDDGDMTIRVRA